jgi:dephospho-CoA kinase
MNKPVIGLLGGIGSGKSQVARVFASRGAKVIAGDELAHQALRQGEIKEAIVRRWGKELLDPHGEVNRRRLAAIVFADPHERRALEELVHPWIRQHIQAEARAAQDNPTVPLIVLDAAIMLEAGWNAVCDRLVYIEAPVKLRRQRVAEQRGWSAQEMEAREQAQMPLTEKAAHADHVLENSASLEHLIRQVDELLRVWGVSVRASPGTKESQERGGLSATP